MHTAHSPNRLIGEKSPYLLQHAHNPVDWRPWGEEAFAEARQRDVPVFLSIGYSTCHWCHVMERESFEDPEVADLMNSHFVNIKVDREERPDVDQVYMATAMLLNGGGGWPLNVALTPDKKPFFAGTYFPKEGRFGRMGMKELVLRLSEIWKTRRAEVEKAGDQVRAALGGEAGPAAGNLDVSAVLRLGFEQLSRRFDARHGGFGNAPKFPTPHNLVFLLRYWRRSGDARALAMAEKSLAGMRLGGIYDHVGFGFHRYSTDARWFLPHFEKMLYDQALLLLAYSEAAEATGKAFYAQTAREIAAYVLRDLTDREGGFYSAEDADSEGEEGRFYLWSFDEVRALLAEEDAHWVMTVYNLRGEGNALEEATGHPTGTNIFHLDGDPVPDSPALPDPARWEDLRGKLFLARQKRVHPYKDDKVLADWNGLMIAALAKAARALGDDAFAAAAAKAADFAVYKMRGADGRLWHRYRDGEFGLPAHLDDYAFLTWGLLELYETGFDAAHLRSALELTEIQIRHFWDEAKGGFFLTADDGEALLVRPKEAYDGALPSGNSVSMLNLLRLARMTGRADFEEKAARISNVFAAVLTQAPMAHAQMLCALDFALGPTSEVVLSGDPKSEDLRALLRATRKDYHPRKVVLLREPGENPSLADLAPFVQTQKPLGKATAYICRNQTCDLPLTEAEAIPGRLQETLK